MAPKTERIEIKDDGWCLGTNFFIQAALFEKTGEADWVIESHGAGERDNRTDGEYHHVFWAWRVVGENTDVITDCELTPPFEIHGNDYSYQSIFNSALSSIPIPHRVNVSAERCRDRRALPSILPAYWDAPEAKTGYCAVLPRTRSRMAKQE